MSFLSRSANSVSGRNIRDATFETKRKVCELLVQEIKVSRNEEGITTFNIVYYFNKDWITDDAKFELLTARTGINDAYWCGGGSVFCVIIC